MTPKSNPYLHNNNIPGISAGAPAPAFGSNPPSSFHQFAGSQTGDRQTATPNANAVNAPSTAALAALRTPAAQNAPPEVQEALIDNAIADFQRMQLNQENQNNFRYLQNLGDNAKVMVRHGYFGLAEVVMSGWNQDGLDTSTTTQEVSVAASQGVTTSVLPADVQVGADEESSATQDHVEPSPRKKTPVRRSARLAKKRSQG